MVALTFLGEPDLPELFCCHNNGNKHDNRASNLRWDTASANNYDAVKHGAHYWANRTECPRGHALVDFNLAPWALRRGSRVCWACARSRSLALKRGETEYYKYSDQYFEQLMNDVQRRDMSA